MGKRIDTSALRGAILHAINVGRDTALEIEIHPLVRCQLDQLPTEREGGRCWQLYVSNALQALKRSGHIAHATGKSRSGWSLTRRGRGAL